MRVIIQRVKEASVQVEKITVGQIQSGILLYVGFEEQDTPKEVAQVVKKIDGLRIFEDENQKMNIALHPEIHQILSISQFTLYGSLKKGKRPSFDRVKKAKEANELYELLNSELRRLGYHVETGMFQRDMKVASINDGPLTFIVDTEEL